MIEHHNFFRNNDYDPTSDLQAISFKWTDPHFPNLSNQGLNEIRATFFRGLEQSKNFCPTYRKAKRLIERTLGADGESWEVAHQLLEEGALLALGITIRREARSLFHERFDNEIRAPLEGEVQRIKAWGAPSLEEFDASRPQRESELLGYLDQVKQECMDVCPSRLDERVEQLKDFSPSLHSYYREAYRTALIDGIYSEEFKTFFNAIAKFEELSVRFLLDDVRTAIEIYHLLHPRKKA